MLRGTLHYGIGGKQLVKMLMLRATLVFLLEGMRSSRKYHCHLSQVLMPGRRNSRLEHAHSSVQHETKIQLAKIQTT